MDQHDRGAEQSEKNALTVAAFTFTAAAAT